LLFKTPKGQSSEAQITAFEDSWHWGEQAEQEFKEILDQSNTDAAEMIQSLRRFLHENDMMAYLVMMCNRLLELHRVLKRTGSLYLHCDPTASHYLKIVTDAIFAPQNFRNEIMWKRQSAHSDSRGYGSVHDIVLFYVKSNDFVWNALYQAYDEEYVEQYYRYKDDDGRRFMSGDLGAAGLQGGGYEYEWKGVTRVWRVPVETMKRLDSERKIFYTRNGIPRIKRYLDEAKGMPIQDVWTDVESLRSWNSEKLGYQTQKPLALLERIINASSNAGDVVLDPFCGCGTAVHAAQKLGRQWIGIDITPLAITLIEKRMKQAFPDLKFEVEGIPKDLDGAQNLALRDKYHFQWWACALVEAQPYQGKKKGADSGIDGVIYFQDDKGPAKKIIVSVKGGESVTRTMIADLKNSVEREEAQIGLFVTLKPPTKPMKVEAVSAGYYESPHSGAFEKIQILTIEGLLNGTESPRYPDLSRGSTSFKQAKVEEEQGDQPELL
jgi:DNA modification methylase